MTSKFRRGGVAYDKQGRSYVVEDVEDGVVYCSAENGVETEFPEAQLVTETEWRSRHVKSEARQGALGERLYERIKASRFYLTPTGKLDPNGALEVLAKVERLMPGILDFAAVITAERALDADGDAGQSDLSTAKCREIFDAARPETRAFLMAGLFATRPDVFVGAAKLGDNLWRAMLEKFTETYGPEFDQFRRAKRK
ncbi:MAG TPA: hypothetical protein VID77_09900 [Stellaceae bacterium]